MILTKAPALEPVSLAQIKSEIGAYPPGDDILLSCLVTAARVVLEARSGLLFLAQGWRLVWDPLPDGCVLKLPFAPVRKVEAVRLCDGDSRPAGLDTARVSLETNCNSQSLRLAPGLVPRDAAIDCRLEVDLVAGLAANPRDLPREITQAVGDLAIHWFARRERVPFGDRQVAIPEKISQRLASISATPWA